MNTQVVEEKEKNIYIEILKVLIKLIFKAFKFGLYVVLQLLKLLISVIEGLFKLDEYRPFQSVSDSIESKRDAQIKDYIDRNTKLHAVTTHSYTFVRSETFAQNYNIVTQRIDQVASLDLRLNEELAKDTIKRLDLILLEAEKQSLKDGYKYAKETKYQLSDDEVYSDFIENNQARLYLDSLEKISKALKCDLKDLFDTI